MARKPAIQIRQGHARNIGDDIGKGVVKAVKSAVKKAEKIVISEESKAVRALERKKNEAALIREWNRKLGADKYISRDVQQAKSRGEIARATSRQRGFVTKTKNVGMRQSANQEKALEQAGARAARRAERRAAGGVNAPKKVAARQKRAAANRKAARPR